MGDDLNGAGITAKERLGRIEEILGDIVGKLDGKADQAVVIALELRVKTLELARAEAEAVERVTGIERVANVAKMETRVDRLESGVDSLGKKVALASGAVSVVVVVVNLIPWLTR